MSATAVIERYVPQGGHQWKGENHWGGKIESLWSLFQEVWPKGSFFVQEEPWEGLLTKFCFN